jgi:hypothetical protein
MTQVSVEDFLRRVEADPEEGAAARAATLIGTEECFADCVDPRACRFNRWVSCAARALYAGAAACRSLRTPEPRLTLPRKHTRVPTSTPHSPVAP